MEKKTRKYYRVKIHRIPPYSSINGSYYYEEDVWAYSEDGARNKNYREKFDIATSRAVANMSVLSEFCLPYVKVGGNFIALKGPAVDQEIEESRNAIGTLGGKLVDICEVNIEETELRHNLVVVEKVKACDKIYPRKAGTITKKPIK